MKKQMVQIRPVLVFILVSTVLGCSAAWARTAASSGTNTALNNFSISGLIEAEAYYLDDGDAELSDIRLATADLSFKLRPNDMVTAALTVSLESGIKRSFFPVENTDDYSVSVKEAKVVFGREMHLAAGRMVMPFGYFKSETLADPLLSVLGEIRDEAILLGYQSSGFYFSAYAFKGAVSPEGEEDEINCYGSNLGFTYGGGMMYYDLSFDWVSHMLDTAYGMAVGTSLKDFVPGFATHLVIGSGGLTMTSSYILALEDITYTDATPAIDAPSVYIVEVAYTTKQTTCIIAYQGSENCGGYLPETVYSTTISYGVARGWRMALEYARAEDYAISEGGSDQDSDIYTFQMALAF